MKRLIRVMALLLAMLLAVACLAACGGGGTNETTSNDDEAGTQQPGNNENPDGLPPIVDMRDQYGAEYVYRAYVRIHGGDSVDEQVQNGNNLYKCVDFWVEDVDKNNVDVLSYAVYTRNQKIQENYHCRIVQVDSNGNMYQQLNMAYENDEKYDLTIIMARSAAAAATGNLLQDIRSMDYVELDHPSFDQNSVEQLSMGGKLYYLSGDMNISTMEVCGTTVVNMKLYNSLSETIVEEMGGEEIFADLYQVVKDKYWTMDTLLSIAEIANVDQNKADGELDAAKGDTVGYYQYYRSALFYFYGAGGRITTHDEDGYPEFTIQEERSQDLVDYLYKNFNVVSTSWLPRGYSATREANFLTGNCLFTDCSLFDVRTVYYSQANFEYGILPTPLYEEGDDYKSVVSFDNWNHLWAIPNKANNNEYAQRMLQILTVYSGLKDSTMDAYYTRTLYLNAATNNGSRDVLNIIKGSLVYDIALLYDWGEYEDFLVDLSAASHNQYSSKIANLDEYVVPKLDATIEQFKNPQLASGGN
jgi:hypothetical protein